jgi:uncharacterized protein (TIGR02271 family)
MLIPGFGPVVAGGILATVLGGAAVGAAAGGLLGVLVGMGVPEDEAQYYEGEFNEGRILVTVKAGNRYQDVRNVLQRNGAYDIESGRDTATTPRTPGTTTSTPRAMDTTPARTTESTTDHDRMQLREERLQPRKETVETGEVTIGKEVVTERQEMDVPVRREEVVVERHPASGRATGGDIREGDEIHIPVREERVDVDKQTVAYEEIDVSKRQVQDTEHISADVRREEARIDRDPDVAIRSTGGTTGTGQGWNDVSSTYRQRWQSRFGAQGGRWEDYEPSYRYGYEMGMDPRYQGRDWNQIEPELRTGYSTWAQRNGYRTDANAWERFKDSIRDSWNDARGGRRAA